MPAMTDQIIATNTAAFRAGGRAVVGVVVLFFFICCCGPFCLPEPVPVPLPEKWTRQVFSSEGWVVQLETNEHGELGHVTRVGERLSWDGTGGHRLEAAATTAGDGHLGADQNARRSFDGERYEVGIDECTPFLGGRPRKHSPDAPLSLTLRDDMLYLEIEGCEGWSGPLFRPDQVDLVDTDGDGIPSAQECAWDDASIAKADRARDRDCDGVADDVDCDPANSSTSSRRDEDADCDGLIDAEDCDPRGENFVEDRDCDGMPDAQDCAPEDASNSSSREDDQDCDGISNGEDCAPEDANNATVGCQLPWVAQLDQACFDFDGAANDIQQGEAVRRGRKLTERARVVGRGTLYDMMSANAEATHVKATFRIQDHYFETMVLKGSASYGVLADLTEGECAEFTISDLKIDAWLDRSRVCRSVTGNRTFSGRLVRLSECA